MRAVRTGPARSRTVSRTRAIDVHEGEDGLKTVPPGGFAAVLERYLDGWPETRVLLSGMVTSRTGWLETPCVPCPAGLSDLVRSRILRREGGRHLHFLSGLSHLDGGVLTDVTRGEEVQPPARRREPPSNR
ncbi:2-dehydro-3-deoxygalactonokinase [Jannaschia formosa]|uniref:2-dehydro-3-deoxygalactonokinase n=1 Tax=Jannaschia formosa TaxID=2259592 RepID=UPI000E1BD3E6|nr:2-dehydro-3-deoxygalactonokinase [Jannaschia formosa]TFL17181.1 hypothetical protein DR046_16005 [Jannaschia formosa]